MRPPRPGPGRRRPRTDATWVFLRGTGRATAFGRRHKRTGPTAGRPPRTRNGSPARSDEDLAGPLAAAGPADGADPPVVRLGVALRADLGEPLVHRGLAPPAVVERVALALGRLGVLAGGLVGGEPGGQVAAQDVHPADVLGGELLGVLAVEGLEPLQALLGLRADVGGVAGGDDQLA